MFIYFLGNIHSLFPIWNIWFVSVVDNEDTNIKGNKKSRQINGLYYRQRIMEQSAGVNTAKGQALKVTTKFKYYEVDSNGHMTKKKEPRTAIF